ncbi:unnamed protein product [Musa acuminata subsp. burmannicoides]
MNMWHCRSSGYVLLLLPDLCLFLVDFHAQHGSTLRTLHRMVLMTLMDWKLQQHISQIFCRLSQLMYTDSTGIDSSLPPIGAVKLGIGGFSMGAATALYSASCFAHGRYGNGGRYPINLSAVVGLSGWLPCSRSLKTKVESSQEAARRAASLPLLLCHGTGDGVVPYKQGERSAETLRMSGFRNLRFEAYNGLEHYTIPEEMDAVCKWITTRLQLDGSRA